VGFLGFWDYPEPGLFLADLLRVLSVSTRLHPSPGQPWWAPSNLWLP
jgi:hypothetical protein